MSSGALSTPASPATPSVANASNNENEQRDGCPNRPVTPDRLTVPLVNGSTNNNSDHVGPEISPNEISGAKASPRPKLLSKATTAVSRTDIHSGASPNAGSGSPRPPQRNRATSNASILTSRRVTGGFDDSASIRSIRSSFPAWDAAGDAESLLGGVLGADGHTEWRDSMMMADYDELFELSQYEEQFQSQFENEFRELPPIEADGSNEESLMLAWRLKMKHFLIFSSAGKPIYSRHGEDGLISNMIGVIQTIISSFQMSEDTLKGFSAGNCRYVILSKGHLHLVAISRLTESDNQIQAQLEALYMQILSTLTLPGMERMFINRPSMDLRRPLEGTEPLLSALADGFTRGSPSSLLSALECLRIRKSHRQVINNTMVATRTPNLLYGLIVAGGRLASVIRPKKHSLHPGDLQLIFNMLFETEIIRQGGGEHWIRLCLPGFNNTGYLYMYVCFLSASKAYEDSENEERPSTPASTDDEIAILLITANNDSFYELQKMRHELVKQLRTNGCLSILNTAIKRGRPASTDIVPGSVLRHFLYKSRANVQFVMPLPEEQFESAVGWRRLMSLYSSLHDDIHNKVSPLKIHLRSTRDNMALAWAGPVFEIYCVAPASVPRNALVQNAGKLVEWIHREEERLFIIGGAVF